MKHPHIRLLTVASAAFFIACQPAAAQWQTPDHSVPIGRGAGTGFKSATGTNNKALMGSTGADPSFRSLVGADLPLPGASSLGGVNSLTPTTSQWLRSLGTDGNFTKSQPAFSDLSGSWSCGQAPALTGDVTTFAGTCATSIAALAVTNGQLAGSIAASKLIGTDIATVGTITTGTWNGAAIDVAHGGTGATTAAGAKTNLALTKSDVGLGNVANLDQTNASNISSGTLNTARLPSPFTSATASGSTSKFATTSGTLGSGCAQFDGFGNLVDVGSACGSGGSGLPAIANGHLIANATGSTASAQDTTVTSLFDVVCSTTVGQFWVRLSGGWGCTSLGYANPVWWGADPTGSADSTAALNSALSASNVVQFPAGKFKFLSTISYNISPSAGWVTTSTTSNSVSTGTKTFTIASCTGITAGDTVTAYHTTTTQQSMTGTVTSCTSGSLVISVASIQNSGTFSAWNIVQNFLARSSIGSLTIRGAGADTTELLFSGVDGFTINYRSQQHAFHAKGFSITSDAVGGHTAIYLKNQYPFFGTFVAQSDFENVTCRGGDGYAISDYWDTCIKIENVSDVNFSGFNAYGDSSGTHGTGILFSSPGAGCFSSPITCGTVYNVVNSNFSFLGVGVNVGSNSQTVQITNSFFAQCSEGILIAASGGTLQGLNVSNSTFFTINRAIVALTAMPNLIFSGNMVTVGVGFYGLDLLQENTTIIGNHFIPRGSANSGAGGIKIAAGTAGSITTITANTFSSVGQAIFLAPSTSGINVQSNAYTGNTGTVLNASSAACPTTSSANCVGGGST